MAGLYVHVPFCHSKCAYCDFYSMPGREDLRLRYANALVKEFVARRQGYGDFSTVYFGGGTPSILSDKEFGILSEMAPTMAEEFTIEVNPEDVTPANVEMWKRHGVNRVSMGVQSLCDEELRIVGRRHTAAQAVEAFYLLRSGGFKNISVDLIYGLPGQTIESWEHSLQSALRLDPEHISAYSLTYEPRTRLSAMLHKGEIAEVDEEVCASMYESLIEATAAAGFEHYEISNFGKPGRHSRHNSAYWNSTPYLGLGPGAHSFDGKNRYANPANLISYLNAIEAGKLPTEMEEESDADRFNDAVITALRTSDGLLIDAVAEGRRRQLLKDAARHIGIGTLVRSGNRLVIPEEKWLLADSVMRDLLQD